MIEKNINISISWHTFDISVDTITQAKTDHELKEEFTKIVMACMKDSPVDILDLMPLQQLIVPTKKEVKCLLACAYKKLGTVSIFFQIPKLLFLK